MKRLFSIFFLSLFSIIANGQSPDSLKHEIDLLDLEKHSVNEQIDSLVTYRLNLQKKISSIKLKLDQLEFEGQENEGVPTRISSLGGELRDAPSMAGNTIIELKSGDEIMLYDWYQEPFFKASYDGKIGYISYARLVENRFIKTILQAKLKKDDPKLARLSKKYGKTIAQRIIRKEIWIGMRSEMARDALGRPNSINRSNYAWGVHEQWVYPRGKYLYFEKGVLTSWQD